MLKIFTQILIGLVFSSACIAQKWDIFNSSNSPIPFNSINALSIDNRGWLWITNANSGDCPHVGWFDGSAWNSYLTTDKVSDVAADNKGDVYFSTSAREILRFHNGAWFTLGSVLLTSATIEPIFCDRSNSLWMGKTGIYNALVKYDGKSWSEFNSSNSGFPGSTITCLQDVGATLWIGTYGHGLVKLTDTLFTAYNPDNSQLPCPVISAMTARNDTLWICCGGELISYKNKFSNVSELPEEVTVYEMAMDSRGNFWFTSNQGLIKYNRKNWTIFNSSNSPMPDAELTSIVIDKSNNIWVGTEAHGLIRYNETAGNAIDDLTNDLKISCYPNPLDTKLHLNFNMNTAGKILIYLTDIHGKICLEKNLGMAFPGNNSMIISLPELAKGVYFLKVFTPSGTEVLKLKK